MKLKSNRFAVIPVMCSHCKRYVWMEPYRSGETWNKFIDRFVKIRLCNECVSRYGVGGIDERVIIDIPDEYAGAVSVTAIGVGQVGMRSEAHIKTTVVVLENECTEIKLEAEERDV